MAKSKHLFWLFALLFSFQAFAQSGQLQGILQDANQQGIEGALISVLGTELQTSSATDGSFKIENIPFGKYTIEINKEQLGVIRKEISIQSENVSMGIMTMSTEIGTDLFQSEDLIPSISLSDGDINNDGGGSQNVSGLLTASRDVFFNTAAFSFGPMRFSIRGYDSENSLVYINGVPMNSPENGRAVWSTWGGLNDALRNRDNVVGLGATEYSMGSLGATSMMDVRAGSQWKQLRVSMAASNRAYRVRPMFIYSTGFNQKGWAYSVSGSWRHAEQTYIPGSYYSAASYFAAIQKKFNKEHSLNFSVIGAPRVRASNAAITTEMLEITREAYDKKGYIYNPYWGYQTSEETGKRQVRNSRQSQVHQPLFILTHDWDINDKSTLTTSAAYQFGRNGSSSLNWFNAADPRPDYYRRWPSYFASTDTTVANQLRQQLIDNPEQMQVNWDNLFEVNRNSYDANFSGTEKRAKYVLEERRYDMKQYTFNTYYRNFITENITLNGGVNGSYYIGQNFKVMEDLLGADYFVDIDQFAQRDSINNPDFAQNDLDNPNRMVRKGERFGYDYETHIQNAGAWVQAQFGFGQFEFFVAAEGTVSRFWRQGNMRNGRFPINSFGKGETHSFLNYAAKGGLTYKINGRNYLFANGTYITRAPYARDAYVSARTRDQVVPGLTSTVIYGGEGGYVLTAPKVKGRIVGYYTKFENEFYNKSFFSDNAFTTDDGSLQSGYVNFVMTGVDRQHMGLELAGEVEVISGLKLRAVAAIGEHIYTSRPDISIFLDNDPNTSVSSRTAYLKRFYVAGSPQMAYSFGVNYSSPKFWFVNLSVNYLARNFVDINPDRRTMEAVSLTNNPQYVQQAVEPGSQLWQDIIYQEELPATFTVDIFGGKSFRLKDKNGKTSFIYLNVGVNNILNNRNIITGGFEQLRFDFENNDPAAFPSRYYYNIGLNYFVSMVYRLPM